MKMIKKILIIKTCYHIKNNNKIKKETKFQKLKQLKKKILENQQGKSFQLKIKSMVRYTNK